MVGNQHWMHWQTARKGKAPVKSLNVSAKDLADMDIYGSDNKKIGEIDKVLAGY